MKGMVVNNDRSSYVVMLIQALKGNLTNNNDWHQCEVVKLITTVSSVKNLSK